MNELWWAQVMLLMSRLLLKNNMWKLMLVWLAYCARRVCVTIIAVWQHVSTFGINVFWRWSEVISADVVIVTILYKLYHFHCFLHMIRLFILDVSIWVKCESSKYIAEKMMLNKAIWIVICVVLDYVLQRKAASFENLRPATLLLQLRLWY